MTGQLAILLLFFVFQASGQISFISPYVGRSLKGTIGSSVQFNWSFSGDVGFVNWGLTQSAQAVLFDNDQRLYSLSKSGVASVVSPPAAYNGRVFGSRSGGKVTFTLSNLQQGDARFYGCEINSAKGGLTKLDNVKLVVEDPPNNIRISGNQTVKEGNILLLNCTADGIPTPNNTWTKLSDNSVVTMPLTINRQSEGGYRCTADNKIGNPAIADVFVSVQYQPDGVTISTSAAQDTVIQGQAVTFTCQVAEAKPQVSEYRFYCNNSLLHSTTNDKYVIRDVRRSQHFCEYRCEAHNDAGDGESGVVVLNVTVPAEIQSLTGNLTVNEGSAIELICDVTGYPSPTITWKKDGQPENSGSSLFRIPKSTRSDNGAYVCTADNGVRNKAEMETFVTVRYKPTIKASMTSAAKSWIGQTVQLTCEADGRPTPTITWKKQDGSKVKEVAATRNNASVEMKTEGDFGTYTCEAKNIVGPATAETVEVKQIKAPGSPIITSAAADIQATSLTVKWNAPTTNGGSPITAYRVVILRGGDVVRNENFTDLAKEKLIGSLNISTNYTVRVYARNFVFEGIAGEKMIRTKFEGVPAAAEILGLPKETNSTKITLRWSEPANNGKPIMNYTVYQRTMREDGTPRVWNRMRVITNISDLQVTVQLEKGKIYEFVVTATNEFGESLKEEKKIKKITVVGGVPSAVKLKVEQKDDKVILTWEKPDGNGAAITNYTVYHRVANTKEWVELTEIPAESPLQYVFEGEKGKEYEFVVTASNRYGESPKADIKSFKVSADESTPPGSSAGRIGTAVIAGAGAAGALLILFLILLIVWWKRRKASSDHGSSVADLHGPNPDDFDDGYHTVGATSAARQLQASGPAGDVTYAEVDKTQKKDKRPVTDVYAEVDKSKKTKKKPKKQPGELDYAELDDLRPNFRPAPQPSGATAKPLVRAPAYQGTEYADITQFGIPQPEPTYDNVPKKDVVYSNVETVRPKT